MDANLVTPRAFDTGIVSSQAWQRGQKSLSEPVAPQGLSIVQLVEKDDARGLATFRYPDGSVVTMAMAPSDVTNQREQLETYLGGFQPFGNIADIVSPHILVDKEKGDRRDLNMENAFEVVDTTMGRQGAFNEIDLLSGLGTYQAREYGLASFLPWQTENDAQANFNLRAAIGRMLLWKLGLHREVRVMTLLTTTGNWLAANRIVITTNFQWDSGSTKNPRLDLHTLYRAMTVAPKGHVMNPDVAYDFLADAEVRAYIRATQGDDGPKPEVAAAAQAGSLGIVTFNLAGMVPFHIVPAKRLVAGALEYIWADDVVVFGDTSQPNDGLTMATSLTYRTKGRSGTGIQAQDYIPQGRGNNSGTMFNVGFAEHELICSSRAGGLVKSVKTGT